MPSNDVENLLSRAVCALIIYDLTDDASTGHNKSFVFEYKPNLNYSPPVNDSRCFHTNNPDQRYLPLLLLSLGRSAPFFWTRVFKVLWYFNLEYRGLISSRRVVYKKPARVDYFTVTNHRASKSECLVRETEAVLLIIQAVSSPLAISRRKSWHLESKRGVNLKRKNNRQTARNWSMNNSMTKTKVCFKHIF